MESIYRYWLLKSESYAVRLYNSFIDEAEILVSFPKAGAQERLLKHHVQVFRSLVVGENYKLVYTIEQENVVIHAVWDCRQNPAVLTDSFR